jgi:hypothetical protein
MPSDAGVVLGRDLHDHTLWWVCGTAEFVLPDRQKSAVSHLAHPKTFGSQFEEQSLCGFVGRRGTLLHVPAGVKNGRNIGSNRDVSLPSDQRGCIASRQRSAHLNRMYDNRWQA